MGLTLLVIERELPTHQRHSRFRIDCRTAVAFAPTCKRPRGGPSLAPNPYC